MYFIEVNVRMTFRNDGWKTDIYLMKSWTQMLVIQCIHNIETGGVKSYS